MVSENDTMMFCEEGKCVDVRTAKCDIAFENLRISKIRLNVKK